jgi:ATP/maltotriose-dependent transcriptional regulator MalT
MLNYTFHENIDESDSIMFFESLSHSSNTTDMNGKFNDVRIISEKINIPKFDIDFCRARLTELLSKQTEQFGTSFILGRAGTGKSTLAIEFAKDYERVAWFRVESTDSEWETFSQYFISSFQNALPTADFGYANDSLSQTQETKVLKFLEKLFYKLEQATQKNRLLIILDDLHNVFDAGWFETFFKGLLSYQLPNVHILLLSRSKPPFPLWRLRSKQQLGFLEENLLLFTVGELEDFLKSDKFSKQKIRQIHKDSYGRISKILELLGLQFIHKTAG